MVFPQPCLKPVFVAWRLVLVVSLPYIHQFYPAGILTSMGDYNTSVTASLCSVVGLSPEILSAFLL